MTTELLEEQYVLQLSTIRFIQRSAITIGLILIDNDIVVMSDRSNYIKCAQMFTRLRIDEPQRDPNIQLLIMDALGAFDFLAHTTISRLNDTMESIACQTAPI